MSGDGLLDEIARAITASLKDGQWRSTTPRDCAAAVRPVVQARIAATRAQVAEQIAQAIEARIKPGIRFDAMLFYKQAAWTARQIDEREDPEC